MSDALISASAAVGTPQLLDAELVTVGINAVLRERVEITGAAATEIARVQATDPAANAMALVVRQAGVPRSVTPNPDWTLGALSVALAGVIAGDTGFGGTEYGLPLFGKRHDANTSLISVDGRFGPMQLSALGNLKVAIIEGAGSGGTAIADLAAFTLGAGSLTPIGGVFQTSLPADLTNGQAAVALLTKKRALFTMLTDSGGIELSDSANHWLKVSNQTKQDVRGTVAENVAVGDPPVFMGGNASAATPAAVGGDGRVKAWWMDTVGRGHVVVDGTVAVSGAGGLSVVDAAAWTTAVSLFAPTGGVFNDSAAALTAGQQGTVRLTADRRLMANVAGFAHGAAITGPVTQGYTTIAHGANPTAIAANLLTQAYANRAGIPFHIGGHPNIVTIEAAFTAAQTDVALVTIGAGLKIVVTQAQLSTDAANTVNVGARVGFGTANTPTTTGVVLTHPGIVPGGLANRGDGSGMLGVGADNEDLRITCSVPTGGSVRALVSYYTIES